MIRVVNQQNPTTVCINQQNPTTVCIYLDRAGMDDAYALVKRGKLNLKGVKDNRYLNGTVLSPTSIYFLALSLTLWSAYLQIPILIVTMYM